MGYTVTEKVGEDGMLHIAVPSAKPGSLVRISVEVPEESAKKGKPSAYGLLKDRLETGDDLNDPIPGLEDYR